MKLAHLQVPAPLCSWEWDSLANVPHHRDQVQCLLTPEQQVAIPCQLLEWLRPVNHTTPGNRDSCVDTTRPPPQPLPLEALPCGAMCCALTFSPGCLSSAGNSNSAIPILECGHPSWRVEGKSSQKGSELAFPDSQLPAEGLPEWHTCLVGEPRWLAPSVYTCRHLRAPSG